jgi:conjugative transposon TraJ protein
MTNVENLQKQRDALEYDARVREGKEWLVDDAAHEEKLSELGIRHVGKIVSMWWERAMYGIKTWFRELISDFFELLFNAAALTIDTLRTFFLVVLAILGPLSFALSIYDGFQSTLTNWIARYVSVYLWLPVADLFSAVLSRIRALMLEHDIALLQDPGYIPDGANGMYIVFLIIGIIGYFSIPTVSEWIIQSGGGASGGLGGVNKAGYFATGVAGGLAGNAIGRATRNRKGGSSGGSPPNGQNLAT